MSKQQIEDCIRTSFDTYFKDLQGEQPTNLHEMLLSVVEKPLLEVVMKEAKNNQCKAAQWLGLNRNTLRKKLLTHSLIKKD